MLLFFSDNAARAMVEGQLLQLTACAVWHMGWCVHLMPHQHPQCCHLPSYGMDCGELSVVSGVLLDTLDRWDGTNRGCVIFSLFVEGGEGGWFPSSQLWRSPCW